MQIRKLNTLRAMAALIVLISHYSNSTQIFGGILGRGAGQLGVMLFFMLSGFLMAYLYLEKDSTPKHIRSFIFARIARVLPLFVIIVGVSYASSQLGFNAVYQIHDYQTLLAHLSFLFGISVLWTIPTEIQFYLLFIILWRLYAQSAIYFYSISVLIFISVVYLNFPRYSGTFFGFPYDLSLLRALPFFLSGTLLGLLYRRWAPPATWQNPWFVVALCAIPLLYPQVFSRLIGYEHQLWQDINIWLVMTLIFFILIFLTAEQHCLLTNRIGDFLGEISYSLYLLHMLVLVQIEASARQAPFMYFPIFILLSILLAYLSYRFIEKPTRQYIRTIANIH